MVKVKLKYYFNSVKYEADILAFKKTIFKMGFRFNEFGDFLTIYFPNKDVAIECIDTLKATKTCQRGLISLYRVSESKMHHIFAADIKHALQCAPNEIKKDADIEALANYLAEIGFIKV